LWKCVVPSGVGLRSICGDMTSKVTGRAGPYFGDIVQSCEMSQDSTWTRVVDTRTPDAKMWIPVRHEGRDVLVARDPEKVYDQRAAAETMGKLFEKRVPQLVAVWYDQRARTSFDMLEQRTAKFDAVRTTYVIHYVDLLTRNGNMDALETLCKRIPKSKGVTYRLKREWATIVSRGLRDLLLRYARGGEVSDRHGAPAKPSDLLIKAYSLYLLAVELDLSSDVRRSSEDALISTYAAGTKRRRDADGSSSSSWVDPPSSWRRISDLERTMRVAANAQRGNLKGESSSLASVDPSIVMTMIQDLLKQATELFRSTNAIRLRNDLENATKQRTYTVLAAWSVLESFSIILENLRELFERSVPQANWDSALKRVRMFKLKFVMDICEAICPARGGRSILSKSRLRLSRDRASPPPISSGGEAATSG